MKRCANGHITRNDSLSFCTECGKLLEPYAPSAAGDEGGGGSIPEPPMPPQKKKSSWLVVKRVLIGIVVLVVVVCVWISSKINSTTYLVFNTEAVVFHKSGGEESVNIDYDGIIWEVTYSPSWLTVLEDDTNNSMTLIAEGNASGSDREDHITVKSGKVICQLPVGQLGHATYLRVDPVRIEVGRGGGSTFVSIESDGVSSEISYPKFSDVETEDNSGFYVRLGHNDGYSRNGQITVSEDGRTATIYVHQVGDCPDCNGRGNRTCPTCNGMGMIGYGMFSSQCFLCGGSGSITCSACHGDGEQ